MKPTINLSSDGKTIDIFIPMELKRQGCRKTILSPRGQVINPDRDEEQDRSLLFALVRAHRWNRELVAGEVATVKELAERENLGASGYVSKILRLSFLAPDIQEAILFAEHPPTLTLAVVMKPFPEEWGEQRRLFGVF